MNSNVKFYQRFNNDTDPQDLPSDEFQGWETAVFEIKQRDNGVGRDEIGNLSEATYSKGRNHHLQKNLQTNDQFGFEADSIQGVLMPDGKRLELEKDFAGSKTNQINSFTCNLIQNGKLQLFKRRLEAKVNIFSDRQPLRHRQDNRLKLHRPHEVR